MSTAPTILSAPAAIVPRSSRVSDLLTLIRPRMNFLVLGTTMVGCCMAAQVPADWHRLPATMLGTALCAAAASILNQVTERRYDALMARTANRPLPMGRITMKNALAFGLASAIVGGLILYYFVNHLTAFLGVFTMASYVLLYTPLKRRTSLNTVVGAIPGAIPPVMGWTAITGSLSPAAASLFAILFVWQIPHFLAIASLYREDYRKGGFRMLPVIDSSGRMTGRQIMLYSAALIPITLSPSMLGIAGRLYLVSALILGLSLMYFSYLAATRRGRIDARRLFVASIIYLPILLTMLMLDRT
jgi:protoheme IX farnesyltransferase